MFIRIAFLFAFAALVFTGCASRGESNSTEVAIDGYDSVSYFAIDNASKGAPQFAFVWKGAKWLFSSQENLDKFKIDPEQYVPQFGSYCPISLGKGGKDKGDPRHFRVYKGKLYLFNNKEFAEQFDKDPEGSTAVAAENYHVES